MHGFPLWILQEERACRKTLTKDTPPKKFFVGALYFLHNDPRLSRPDEGSRFLSGGRVLWYVSSPDTLRQTTTRGRNTRSRRKHTTKPLPRKDSGSPYHGTFPLPFVRKAHDTFNFLRDVMRAIWSVRRKCSHRCKARSSAPAGDRAHLYENETV